MKKTTHNFLISSLSVFGLLGTIVGMAVAIERIVKHNTYTSQTGCKAGVFFELLFILITIFVLIIIAADRYLKICKPVKTQMTRKVAGISIGGATIVSIMISCPRISIYGISNVVESDGDGNATQCKKICDDATYAVYNVTLAVLFITLTMAITVMYALIRRTVRRHGTSLQQNTATRSRESMSVKYPSMSRSSQSMLDKTSGIGLAITMVFIVSFFPSLVITLLELVDKNIMSSSSRDKGSLAINICLRMYFINDAVNPIIYGVMNTEFRSNVVQLVNNIFHNRNKVKPVESTKENS